MPAGQTYTQALEATIAALQDADGTMRRLFGGVGADLTVTPTRVA